MSEEVNDDTGLTKDEFAVAFEAAAGLEEPVVEDTSPAESADLSDAGVAPVLDPVVPEPPVVEAAKPDPVVVAPPPPPEPAKPEPTPEPPAPVVTADEAFTEEETVLLDSVNANFPEIRTLLDSVKRVTIAQVENKFMAKIAELETKLSQSFAPAINVAQTVAHDRFMTAVLGAHSDAGELLPKVEEWVKTQPEFLQDSYNAVLDKGTAAQTIKLYDIFKKETGSAQVPPLPPPEDAEAKATKERKLRSQEGVRTRQVAQKGGIDENDFEGAFRAASTKH